MARVLIADDDDAFRAGVFETLTDVGHTAVEAEDGAGAIAALRRGGLDAALIDLRMPTPGGLEVLAFARSAPRGSMPPIIVLTGFADAANTIEAMRLGAFDHLTKPVGRAELLGVLDEALALSAQRAIDRGGTESDETGTSFITRRDDLVGSSPAMREVHKRIGRASRSDAAVLITGETGTGKEMVARALHRHGDRAKAPFIAVNCAAIPADLLESELFGHVKGAFSGAVGPRVGMFEQADGGTLFLDEIGDMPLAMQAKLLRVLQDRSITPVGGSQSRTIDARIVTATHRDLEQAVVDGSFRADLRYRLDVLRIQLPPLREHHDDIVALACHFLRLIDPDLQLSSEAAARLQQHDWPGNVRELRNAIVRAAAVCRGDVLRAEDLDLAAPPARMCESPALAKARETSSLPRAVAQLERDLIVQALRRADGNRTKAARLLGIRRQLLYTKLASLGLDDTADESMASHARVTDAGPAQ